MIFTYTMKSVVHAEKVPFTLYNDLYQTKLDH